MIKNILTCIANNKPITPKQFSKKAYLELSTTAFIAHFDHEGFIRARFSTYEDLESTLYTIEHSKALKHYTDFNGYNELKNKALKALVKKERLQLVHGLASLDNILGSL